MNELEQITAALVGAGHREYKVDEVPEVIPDAPTFGDIARSIPKEDAARKYAETAVILQGMLTVNEELHAVDEAQHRGVTRAQDARVELRKEQAVQSVEECKQALEEQAEWAELSSVWAKREEQIRFLNVAVEYGQQVLIPASRLRLLESDYAMASMHARLLTWKAIVAGIERYEASKALLEVDGTAVFSVVGRAFTLLQESHQAHAMAARAGDAYRMEKARQKEKESQK